MAKQELKRIALAVARHQVGPVVHIAGKESIDEALEIEPLVDALLLDSGNTKLAIKELGGTEDGRTTGASVARSAKRPCGSGFSSQAGW